MARPRLMGIVNVTPDSFSDGGEFLDADRAVAHGERMIGEGADLLDVGGESTRPGAEAVDADTELARVLPVIEGLAGRGVPVSIDTSKAEVAATAIGAGAAIVNDVTALGDPDMAAVCAGHGVGMVLMHMQGTPRTMQEDPTYGDVVEDVKAFLADRIGRAVAGGVSEEAIWVDPGIGFGKTVQHNLELIRRLGELRELGRPIVLGASRKSFLGKLTGRGAADRVAGTVAANVLGAQAGADVLRVHDLGAAQDAMTVLEAVESS